VKGKGSRHAWIKPVKPIEFNGYFYDLITDIRNYVVGREGCDLHIRCSCLLESLALVVVAWCVERATGSLVRQLLYSWIGLRLTR